MRTVAGVRATRAPQVVSAVKEQPAGRGGHGFGRCGHSCQPYLGTGTSTGTDTGTEAGERLHQQGHTVLNNHGRTWNCRHAHNARTSGDASRSGFAGLA